MVLVRGGTPQSFSNRMIEPAYELEEPLAPYNQQPFDENTTLLGVKTYLVNIGIAGLNIVGSRDYVYNSAKLLLALEHVEKNPDNADYRVFPRTGGLRETIMRCLK